MNQEFDCLPSNQVGTDVVVSFQRRSGCLRAFFRANISYAKRGLATLLICVGFCQGAWANEEVPVGRLDVTLPAGAWQLLEVPDSGAKYGGDSSGVIASETKLFYLAGESDTLLALIAVRANSSGFGRPARMAYTGGCSSQTWFFSEGSDGVNAPSRNCLYVLPPMPAEQALEVLAKGLIDPIKAAGLKLPDQFHSLFVRQDISTGAFGQAHAFFARPVVSDPDRSVDMNLPQNVAVAQVGWGRDLYKALKNAVYSISGNLHIPSIEFHP